MKKENEIKGGQKERFYGTVVGYLIKLYTKTLRFTLIDKSQGVVASGKACVFIFWHNRILALGEGLKIFPEVKLHCLTSASKDGALIEGAMSVNGISSVRGSSSRRGKRALVEMMKTIKAGSSMAITPDGPRGPLYNLNMGALKLAQKMQCPLVAVQVEYSRYWELKTWDQFRIPKPFTRVEIVINPPENISADLEDSEMMKIRDSLEELLISPPSYSKEESYEENRW